MKSFVAGLVLLFAGLGMGAQEAPIAVLESSWPVPGRVTEMRVIQDLQGGVYVPYIADGTFRVVRAGSGGKPVPYEPEGFDGLPPAARDLQAISDGAERYVAFIGRDLDESIQLFGFGFHDALSYYPLAETKAQAITDYALVRSGNSGVAVYTLAEGRLRSFSTGIYGDAPRQTREISRPGENVDAFGVRREFNREISYGWYRVARKDYWELILFALSDGGNLVVEQTRSWSLLPRLEYDVSPEGKAVFSITAGGSVLVCHAEGSAFVRDLYFEAPFAVKRYIPALLTQGPVGLLLGEAEGSELLYGVSHERSGAPAFRELFAGPAAEILELFFTDTKRISLLCRSDQTLVAALLHPEGGIIAEGPRPVRPRGAALFRHPLGESRVYAPSGAGSEESCDLSLFEFEGETWRPAGEARLPGFFPEEADSPLGLRKEGLLLLSSPRALMLYETESSGGQILEMESYDRSVAHNGVIYLGLSSENEIALYRIEE
jgi:hypothetical protein